MEKARILVVDDSVINLATVEQKLKDIYEVIPINSGTRALSYLRNETPDLILLDIGMADKDGIQTLKELRAMEHCKKIPVIMLTARGDRDSIINSQKLGIDDYVLKPYETEELRFRIQKALIAAQNNSEASEIVEREY